MQNIYSFGVNFKKKHDCWISIYGGSQSEGKVKQLDTSLEFIEDADISKARALLLEAIEDFVVHINQDEKLKPYLKHYPFTYNDVEISVTFSQSNGDFVTNGYVAHASLINGKIFYSIYDEKTKRLETLAREPYTDALQLVAKR